MSSGTLVGSLIFAAVLVVVITVLIQLMMRSWQRRTQRQQELIGELPTMPDRVGAATITTRGHYCGSMMAPDWSERIAAGDLGFRSKAVLTRYPEGIMVERVRAQPIWIPHDAVAGVRIERRMANRVAARIGILAIRWRLPSGAQIDTAFRANHREEYDAWIKEAA
ncbi:transporter [Mycobacterium paraense]|uniref:Transporter n=1 Tax=Mycobacterium paraense TaxID=767916 RepID=A0A1X2ABC4_9MYCO|nr:transporter [Mycobacterium paraense]MCV7442225.1 transporter [Mycobacterium paraense]ORW29537.1 transporter [Mycobacterium paraense]ORW37680.1 transporter [Mycobacterium paraense]ORW47980.1 transporter [Mycobacterium paraense]ORW48113.1 transporter [Mycobacterium paraense]